MSVESCVEVQRPKPKVTSLCMRCTWNKRRSKVEEYSCLGACIYTRVNWHSISLHSSPSTGSCFLKPEPMTLYSSSSGSQGSDLQCCCSHGGAGILFMFFRRWSILELCTVYSAGQESQWQQFGVAVVAVFVMFLQDLQEKLRRRLESSSP